MMQINEILNLYKLTDNPKKLAHFDDVAKGQPSIKGEPIKIKSSSRTSITFPYFVITHQNKEKPTELSKILGTNNRIDSWRGKPEDFAWDRFPIQKAHYAKLVNILKRNGLKFDYMWFITVLGSNGWERDRHPIHWFVVISGPPEDPNFIWYKYGGWSPQAGQNWVYPSPKMLSSKIQVSSFFAHSTRQQNTMIQNRPLEKKSADPSTSDKHEWRINYSYDDEYTGQKKIFRFKVPSTTASGAKAKVIRLIKRDQAKYEPANWSGFNYYGHLSDPVRVVPKVKT
jgi:hypothetical protein